MPEATYRAWRRKEADQNFGWWNNRLANNTNQSFLDLPGVLLSHPLSQHPLIPAWFRPVPLGIAVWHIAMSLTSRVFGLFSTATSNSTAPVEDSSTPTWAHPIPTGGINDSYHTVRNDHALLEEEEPRPPYLHVQLSLATSHHCARADLIPNYRRCWLVVPEEHVATC
jgi:hypothetical protein